MEKDKKPKPDVYHVRFIKKSIKLTSKKAPVFRHIRETVPSKLKIGKYCLYKNDPLPICRIKGKEGYFKGRSEMLIFRNVDGIDKVFFTDKKSEICSTKEFKFALPGGGWSKGESHRRTAIRETHEEARREVKNVEYASWYIAGESKKGHDRDKIPHKYRHYKYYTEIFIADYDGHYHGHVDSQDKDRRIKEGEFYPIDEYYDKFRPEHKQAIDLWRERKNKSVD